MRSRSRFTTTNAVTIASGAGNPYFSVRFRCLGINLDKHSIGHGGGFAGPAHMGAIVSGNIALFNTKGYGQGAGAPPENKDRAGVFGGFELSTSGAKKIWEMDDIPENWTEVRPDLGRIRGAIVHDGVAYMVIGNLAPINDNPSRRNYLVSVDLKSGKVIQRGTTPMPVFAGTPYAVENRVIVAGNVGHSWDEVHFFDFKLKQNGAFEPAPQPYFPGKAGVFFVTEYEAPIEFAWWKGRMIGKTRKGLVCLDLRKP